MTQKTFLSPLFFIINSSQFFAPFFPSTSSILVHLSKLELNFFPFLPLSWTGKPISGSERMIILAEDLILKHPVFTHKGLFYYTLWSVSPTRSFHSIKRVKDRAIFHGGGT